MTQLKVITYSSVIETFISDNCDVISSDNNWFKIEKNICVNIEKNTENNIMKPCEDIERESEKKNLGAELEHGTINIENLRLKEVTNIERLEGKNTEKNYSNTSRQNVKSVDIINAFQHLSFTTKTLKKKNLRNGGLSAIYRKVGCSVQITTENYMS